MSSPFLATATCPHSHSYDYYNCVMVVLKAVEIWTARLVLSPWTKVCHLQ